jgi:hypothetical protein
VSRWGRAASAYFSGRVLAGVRRNFVHTTVKTQASDLVDRNSTVESRICCGSPTSPTFRPGRALSMVLLDACSRRIVGWSMATTLAHAAGARRANMSRVCSRNARLPEERHLLECRMLLLHSRLRTRCYIGSPRLPRMPAIPGSQGSSCLLTRLYAPSGDLSGLLTRHQPAIG